MKQPLGSSGAAWTRCRVAVLIGMVAGSMAASAKPVLVVDGDADGVSDEQDDCPYSLPGEAVDARGCGVDGDADGDGVADAADLCTYTDDGAFVDAEGCALDDDFDGVANGIDQCPGTPLGERVDRRGCEPDTIAPDARSPLSKPSGPAIKPAPLPQTAPRPSTPAPTVVAPAPAPAQIQAPIPVPAAAAAPEQKTAIPAPAAPSPAIAAPVASPTPQVAGTVEVAESLAEIGFDANSAALTAAARGRVLALAAETQPRLASVPGTMLRLAGHHHIDEKPELEAQRSASLRDALIAAGIPAARIRIDHVNDARRRDGSGRRVSVQFLTTR